MTTETPAELPRSLQDQRSLIELPPPPAYAQMSPQELAERLTQVDAQLDNLTSLLDRTMTSESEYPRGFLRGLINALVLVRTGHF